MSEKTNAVVVRAARASDAGEIARLTTELGYAATTADIVARLAEMLASQHHFAAVATGPGETLLGWVTAERCVSLESGAKAEITGLVVAAAARRQGVGAALVAAAERWARSQGMDALRVRSNVARAESHPFYLRMDFVLKKTQHTYEKSLEDS